MRVLDILLFMGELGARYKRRDIPLIENYFSQMISDGRVAIIYRNSVPQAILTFSICNNMVKYYQKGMWDYVPHNPLGTIVYVEKLACRYWDKNMRQEFQELITERYPNFERAIWHRSGRNRDRKVEYQRRLQCMR